jgi:hypothetical protein
MRMRGLVGPSRRREVLKKFSQNSEKSDHLGDTGVNERIILK